MVPLAPMGHSFSDESLSLSDPLALLASLVLLRLVPFSLLFHLLSVSSAHCSFFSFGKYVRTPSQSDQMRP